MGNVSDHSGWVSSSHWQVLYQDGQPVRVATVSWDRDLGQEIVAELAEDGWEVELGEWQPSGEGEEREVVAQVRACRRR